MEEGTHRWSPLASERMRKRPGPCRAAWVGSAHLGLHLRFCELWARPRLGTGPPLFPAFSKLIISAHPEGGWRRSPTSSFSYSPKKSQCLLSEQNNSLYQYVFVCHSPWILILRNDLDSVFH